MGESLGGDYVNLPFQLPRSETDLQPNGQRKPHQKKTPLACLPCQRSHYPCDEGRPCQSCLRRGRADRCVDGQKKRAKYLDQQQLQRSQRQLESEGPALKLLAGTATHLVMNSKNDTLYTREGAGGATSFTTEANGYRYRPVRIVNTIGSLPENPYNYGPSYYRVLEMLQRRLSPEGMRRVCQAFAAFRPSLITHLRELSDEDLRLMECCFLRTLQDLRRVLPLTGAPHLLWRRTGEVCYVSAEFALLTGWTQITLGDGRKTVFEVMDEKAVVRYWEEYSRCVLERTLDMFRMSGAIIRPDGRTIDGLWWLTIRKDIFDIPLMVVACFLPDLWQTMAHQS